MVNGLAVLTLVHVGSADRNDFRLVVISDAELQR